MWAATALAGLTVSMTACIGSVSKNDLDAEVRARGGGIGERLALGAVEAIATELGVDDLELRSLTLSPGTAVAEVRVPGTTRDLDRYRYGTSGLYGGRGLSEPTPVAVPAQAPPVESQVFRSDDARLDEVDEMVDSALDEAALDSGYVENVVVMRSPGRADTGTGTSASTTGPRPTGPRPTGPGPGGTEAGTTAPGPAAVGADVAVTVTNDRATVIVTFAADGTRTATAR